MINNGRPKNLEGREQKEILCYDFLDSLNIEYTQIDHGPAMTMEACAEIDKKLNIRICKNLFLCNRQETSFYLLCMPGDKVFKTKDLSSQIGSSRLSFASAENMEKYLNVTPGSASVLALMNDKENAVQLLIDSEILERENFGCHPCKNTSSLRFKVSDLERKIIPALKHSPIVVKL